MLSEAGVTSNLGRPGAAAGRGVPGQFSPGRNVRVST